MDNEAEALSEENRALLERLDKTLLEGPFAPAMPWAELNCLLDAARADPRPSTPDEREANARLIAAAPEMLEALRKARHALVVTDNVRASDLSPAEFQAKVRAGIDPSELEWMTDNGPEIAAIDAALAKADAILARRVVKITPAMIRVVAAVIPGPEAYDIAHDRLARALAIAALTKGADHD